MRRSRPLTHRHAHRGPHRSGRNRTVAGLVALATLAAACSTAGTAGGRGTSAPPPASSPASSTVAGGTTQTAGGSSSTTTLPLGDGKVTSGTPEAGYVDSCQTGRTRGGPAHSGPWINSDGTWTPAEKVAVQGSNAWPQAYFHQSVSGSVRTITADDIPVGATTGNFPIATTDPAYQYDHNPNHVQPNAITLTIPADPTAAPTPGCLPMGPIGITTSGVWLYNALDNGNLDAVAHETQDSCGGHPDGHDRYHYHDIGPCLMATATGSSTLVGYALDGYGIYVEHNADGSLVTDAQLDACHGRTSPVLWDGTVVDMYHYDATAAYPYTLGCFHGVVPTSAVISSGHTPAQFA